MILALACFFILLYGLNQYVKGSKGRGVFVFFFFLTGGFHFLNQSWCPVKYPDFAVVYLVAVALLNILNSNRKFFKPKIKIYKVVTIIGLYITLEFVRTIALKEELFSFALANYRTYIPFFSFWLVQELKGWEVRRLLKQIASITIVSTVLFDLQPLLNIKILQHAAMGETRLRNIPYLAYFFMFLATIRLKFSKWRTVVLLLSFLMAIVLSQHRAVMLGYLICVGVYLIMTNKKKQFFQYCMIGVVVFMVAGNAIMARFEEEVNDTSTIDDIEEVADMDFEKIRKNDYENDSGTLSFRVKLLTERVDYMLRNPRYIVFGIGTRHEDSPYTEQFNFTLGSYRRDIHRYDQITSGDLAWLNPLMRFGLLGIALLLFFSWEIIKYFYKNSKKTDITMASFLFYLFLIIISFKNDHLYGNMQLFFVYLLIEYIRYSNVKLRVSSFASNINAWHYKRKGRRPDFVNKTMQEHRRDSQLDSFGI